MKYTFDCDRWGSSFSVPSKVVDKYIKLSDGDFVKVLLCILCSTERECDSAKLAEKSGLSENTVIDAVTHWVSLGVITTEHSDTTILHRSKPFLHLFQSLKQRPNLFQKWRQLPRNVRAFQTSCA